MSGGSSPHTRRLRGMLLLALLYCALAYVLPRPASLTPAAWRLAALFLTTVAGLVFQPMPGGALVLLAVALAPFLTSLKLADALGGYSDPTVWLVVSAFFISRALLNTGLARRIALGFVRWFGSSTVGVCYALGLSDMVLATIIPSNGARSGGVVLPIARSIADLYGSEPGGSARRLGSYLMAAVYQTICVTAAMFLTGQASNPLAAQMAGAYGYKVTWAGWLAAGFVPGLISLAVIPWVVLKLYPPEIRNTPEATTFARTEIGKMGPMSAREKVLTGIFAAVCTAWVSSSWTGVDITLVALCGCAALLATGVLEWSDIVREHAAWDLFFWYGGLVRLGKALNEQGVTHAFAQGVGASFSALDWLPLLLVALLVFYYAHYLFASITAHILAMYAPFLALLAAKGAPIGLVVFSFACLANLSAGLTNYGTTPSPMFFAQGYVSMGDWYRIGFVVSLCHLLIWGTAGLAWWKLLGLW
ncbi:MAG: DASS family sodium-coupled anion symporter [Acidobacteria bacterium]|nr:DASS family sodium-coupled anion symporter [Acidobacteriota bacterium]